MGEKPKRPGSIAFLVGLVVLAMVLTAASFVPLITCTKCLGEGLREEPAGFGTTRWAKNFNELGHRQCDCCWDRHAINLLRKWQRRGEPAPVSPMYRGNSAEVFTEVRRARIKSIREEATKSPGGQPPAGSSSRPDYLPLLKDALEDEDREVREQTICTLAYMNDDKALPILTQALKHGEYTSRHFACMGLERLGRSKANRTVVVSALSGLCEATGAPSELRFTAACSLFELGELPSVDIFVDALRKGSGERAPVVARVLAQRDRKDTVLLLIRQLASQPPSEAKVIGESLERLTGQRFGADPVAWYRWFEKNRDSLPEQSQ